MGRRWSNGYIAVAVSDYDHITRSILVHFPLRTDVYDGKHGKILVYIQIFISVTSGSTLYFTIFSRPSSSLQQLQGITINIF